MIICTTMPFSVAMMAIALRMRGEAPVTRWKTRASGAPDWASSAGGTTCTATVANGTQIPTSTVGAKTFTVTATDGAANTTTRTNQYTVVYPFTGFLAPVNNQPTVNTVNAGRAIPVKFRLGGNQGLSIFAPGYPKVQTIGCATGVPTDEVETTTTAGQSTLTYDQATDTYSYVWKTDAAWAGTCRRLILGLNDTTNHVADFKLR